MLHTCPTRSSTCHYIASCTCAQPGPVVRNIQARVSFRGGGHLPLPPENILALLGNFKFKRYIIQPSCLPRFALWNPASTVLLRTVGVAHVHNNQVSCIASLLQQKLKALTVHLHATLTFRPFRGSLCDATMIGISML